MMRPHTRVAAVAVSLVLAGCGAGLAARQAEARLAQLTEQCRLDAARAKVAEDLRAEIKSLTIESDRLSDELTDAQTEIARLQAELDRR